MTATIRTALPPRFAPLSSLLFALGLASAPAVAQGEVYWTTTQHFSPVLKANLDGSDQQQAFFPGLSNFSVSGLEVAGDKIYYTTTQSFTPIFQADLDGSNQEVLFDPFLLNVSIASLAVADGKIYFAGTQGTAPTSNPFGGGSSASQPSAIYRANLDGSDEEELFTPTLSPFGITALAVVGDKVYWGTGQFFSAIFEANLDGTNQKELFNPGLSTFSIDGLDVADGKIYWTTTQFFQAIFQANLDGTDQKPLFTPQISTFSISGLAVDVPAPPPPPTPVITCTQYGAGLGAANVLNLTCTGPASLGESFSLATSGVTGPLALLAIGADKGTLPFESGVVLLDLASIFVMLQVPAFGGVASQNLVASPSATIGTQVFLQSFDPFHPGFPGGLSFSNGLELTIVAQ